MYSKLKTKSIYFSSIDLQMLVEVCILEQDIARGLMHRMTPLKNNEGMLFLMPESKCHRFWMKNTFIPLDILFIDTNKKIVDIYKNAKPLSIENMISKVSCKYVLEVAAGFCNRNKIRPGLIIDFK
jgi:uncharacterized membrane protein (UPF0127 family)